jgi:membrane protease YdiL (CAAX protease family)
MKHLEAAFAGKNAFWRYLVMLVAIFVVSNILGSLPLLIIMVVKYLSNPGASSLLSGSTDISAMAGVGSNAMLALMLFPFIAGLAAFILLLKPLHSRKFLQVINGSGSFRWNRFLVSMAVWMVLSMIYLFIYLKAQPANFTLNNTGRSLIPLILISFALIPFQAAFEEILFRGYLMQGFTALYRWRWFPLVATSVLFGLMHSINPEVKEYGFFTMIPQYIVFGLIFGSVAILDDGIEAAIGAHAGNNVFLCIMLTTKSSALQTEAVYTQVTVYPWLEFAGLVISGLVFIGILALVFHWNSFSALAGKAEIPVKSEAVN